MQIKSKSTLTRGESTESQTGLENLRVVDICCIFVLLFLAYKRRMQCVVQFKCASMQNSWFCVVIMQVSLENYRHTYTRYEVEIFHSLVQNK